MRIEIILRSARARRSSFIAQSRASTVRLRGGLSKTTRRNRDASPETGQRPDGRGHLQASWARLLDVPAALARRLTSGTPAARLSARDRTAEGREGMAGGLRRCVMKASLGTMLVLVLFVAQAYGAEAGTCVKSAKVEGRFLGAYLDAACTKPASEAQQAAGRQNKFAWQSLAAPVAFTTHKTGTVQVLTSAGTEIECNSQHFVSKAEWLDGVEGIHTIGFYCSISQGFEQRRQKYWESKTVFRTTFEGPPGHVWERYEARARGAAGLRRGIRSRPDRPPRRLLLGRARQAGPHDLEISA